MFINKFASFLFNSLQGRSIINGLVIIIVLFIMTLFSRQQLLQVLDNGLEITTKYDSFRQHLMQIDDPLKEIESQLYLYTILLNQEQKNQALGYMNAISLAVNKIRQHPLSKDSKDFQDDINLFNQLLDQININLQPVLNFAYKDRFKRIADIVEKLTPNHADFIRVITHAKNDYLFYVDEDDETGSEINAAKIYQQIHLFWIQYVSTARALLAAKTGVLGEEPQLFITFAENLKNYQSSIETELLSLKKLMLEDNWDESQQQYFKQMQLISSQRFANIDALLKMPYQQQMREDIPIIQQTLKPLFNQANSQLKKMQEHIDRLIKENLANSQQHINLTSNMLWGYFVVVLMLLLILFLMTEFWLRRPLELLGLAIRLEGEGKGEGEDKDSRHVTDKKYHTKLVEQGIDEIDVLVKAFNIMRLQIKNRQEQLLEASRHAGKAEVATSVLHNVGNVLNAINASIQMVKETISSSKLKGLQQASQMLIDNKAQLADYIQHDNKGRLLPDYLSGLADVLTKEQQHVSEETQIMSKNIEHINTIVQAQQSLAGESNVIEKINISSLFDDAFKVNQASLDRHLVHANKEVPDDLWFKLDKHKTLQILVNLISNAKQAFTETPINDHNQEAKIVSSALVNQQGELELMVRDNGSGIKKEHLKKVFSFGFTTKQDGHGFGLHSCVLAANEMGGQLLVSSDGENQGACFTLVIPPLNH